MLSDGILSQVKQLEIELHIGGTDTKGLVSIYMTLKQLEDRGF